MSKIIKKYISADAVDDSKIRLSNDAYLRARNNANSADVNLLKLNASDAIEFASLPQVASNPTVAAELARKAYVDSEVSVVQGDIDGHQDGGANKHDASEIDVEAADGKNHAAGSVEAVIGQLDDAIGELSFVPSNYANPASDIVADHLQAIDTALGTANSDEQIKISANDTTAGYLEDKIVASEGANSVNIIEISTLNDAANEDLQIQIDEGKIDHGSIAGLGDDDHSQYHNDTRGDARYRTQSELSSNANANGASLIGIEDANTQFVSTNVEGALDEAMDAAQAAQASADAIDDHSHSNKAVLDATTASFLIADESKLDGIEAGADVTDATNVDAAGATMNSDASLVGNSYFLDEDNMASDSASKVPSQQSVKAYVDAEVAAAVAGGASFEGDYNASTNSPDLDTTPIAGLTKGDMYAVTVAGTFFTIECEAGDMLIAKQDSPTLEAHWTVVQANLTPASIKSQYESNADTNAFTDADESKLDGIEALADVTDATNVAAAGATMDSDASLAGNSYFLDEDNMASDSATKVASQQSIKAYVDGLNFVASGETITLTGTDITNQYVDLAQPIQSAAQLSVTPKGGPQQNLTDDYTVSLTGGAGGVTRVTFAGDLASEAASGDKLMFRYSY
jgi:hypothetical protein